MKKSLISVVSLLIGLFSLGFAIYKSKETTLLVGFMVMMFVTFVGVLIYQIHELVRENRGDIDKLRNDLKRFEENLSIYERLTRLENKIFKGGR